MSSKDFLNVSSKQADTIVDLLREMLGPEISSMMDSHGLNMNHFVRFQHIPKLCRNKREEKGWSFKDVSVRLRIPQYRLKEIEGNRLTEIRPHELEKYIDFLGLQNEFHDWLKDNQDVYEEIGKNG